MRVIIFQPFTNISLLNYARRVISIYLKYQVNKMNRIRLDFI